MILIIGAGLSGLLTGYRLKKLGIPFKILEARSRVGGRIHTMLGTEQTPSEMGATWFQSPHKQLIALLEELQIDYFEQFMDGTAYYQPAVHAPIQAVQLPKQPPSFRISGGTSHLINTLYNALSEQDIVFNQTVQKITFHKTGVQILTDQIFEGNQVVLAIPPKLWSKKIEFEPKLPYNLEQTARQTHTWMEDSIKIALTFKNPFWRSKNLSGAFFSQAGPVTELYDHCNHHQSKFALCGFVNSALKSLSKKERQALIVEQLTAAFGDSIEDYTDYKECVWREENYTFEASDAFLFPHQNNGNPIFRESFYDDRLLISSSETASEFAGYMDGAVQIGNYIAEKIHQGIRR